MLIQLTSAEIPLQINPLNATYMHYSITTIHNKNSKKQKTTNRHAKQNQRTKTVKTD